MPVGLAIGGAAVGLGGALMTSHAQNKATKQAANTQEAATQSQLQLGRESLAQNREIYDRNTALLNPFVQRGNTAGVALNSLLGLPSAPAAPVPAPPAAGGVQTAPVAGQVPLPASSVGQLLRQPGSAPAIMGGRAALGGAQSPAVRALLMGAEPFGLAGSMGPGSPLNGNHLPMNGGQTITPQPVLGTPGNPTGTPAPGAVTVPAPAPSASPYNAFQDFANSAGMKFQLDQGGKMINNRYAALGQLQSGAALKALQNYGQQTALNNYFMPYMGLLGGQQSVGAQAGSAVAGVGSSFGNTAANINAGMGSAIQNGATNIGNLQLQRGQNNANLYGQLASSFGTLAGALGGGGGIGTHFNPSNPGVGY